MDAQPAVPGRQLIGGSITASYIPAGPQQPRGPDLPEIRLQTAAQSPPRQPACYPQASKLCCFNLVQFRASESYVCGSLQAVFVRSREGICPATPNDTAWGSNQPKAQGVRRVQASDHHVPESSRSYHSFAPPTNPFRALATG